MKKWILILGLLLLPRLCGAGTYYAASCSYADVNDCVNGSGVNTCKLNNEGSGATHTAVNGDTIIIPAGTCTWTSYLSFSVGITITGSGTPNTGPSTFGAGTPTTIIIDNAGSSNPLLTATGVTYGNTLVIALMDIEPESSSTSLISPVSAQGTCTSSGCPNIRIDNMIFGETTPWTESGNGSAAAVMIRQDGFFGVYDHNTMPSGAGTEFADSSLSAYLGVGSYGDNSWAQPDTMGTASAIYLENNVFNNWEELTDCEFLAVNGNVCGSREVGRFNHITSTGGLSFAAFSGHGLDTLGRPQGMRQKEVYGNTVTCTGSGGCGDAATTFRSGGTGIIFGNTITANAGTYFSQIADFSIYRNVYGATNGWGYCGGGSAYDTNDGTKYYDSDANSTTASSLTITIGGTSPGWTVNQWNPSGYPYSVYDVTQGFYAEIVSNTADSITVESPISESTWTAFANNDEIQIYRATVCADQGGRGQGNYVSGSTPSPASALDQALDPVYEFADTTSGSVNAILQDNATTRLIRNRDFYYENSNQAAQTSSSSPFNGSATIGVGHGTLANRPSTCTTGVGYFATDQGNWNSSGNGFGNGEFFICTATNTWTLDYTPYTYPHPLTVQTATPIAPAAAFFAENIPLRFSRPLFEPSIVPADPVITALREFPIPLSIRGL